jgi:hypothetical protein
LDSQDSPWPRLGGSHHLPPYSIFYASSRGPHPNDILSWDSEWESSKFSKLGLLRLFGLIIFCADLWLKWGLKQSCSPCWKLSNNVTRHLHPRKSGLFLTFNGQKSNCQFDYSLSFGHNLCFEYLNGSCKPILDIYVSISFQWYKKLLNPMGFDPCNCPLKVWEFIGTPIPKMGVHLGVRRFIPHTLLHSWEHEMWPPTSLLAHNLANPCFGCKLKAKVAIDLEFRMQFALLISCC